MAKKKTARKPRRARGGAKWSSSRASSPGQPRKAGANVLYALVKGAERRDVGGVRLEVIRAGNARVKRMIYPPKFRWSKDMKPIVGTESCMHAHVGFLASGRIHIEYDDGCTVEHTAPQVVAIEPGHDGWVVGNQAAVLIEFDFEADTVARLGMPDRHQH